MFEFYWKVPESGFEWAQGRSFGPEPSGAHGRTGEEKTYLCQRGDTGRTNAPLNYRTYAPLQGGALFKNFADIEQTQEGILAFANEYGALGGFASTLIGRDARVDDDENPYYAVQAEPLDIWLSEIRAVRHAIHLWEALKRKDTEFLSKFIQWKEDSTTKRETAEYRGPQFGVTGLSAESLSIRPELRSVFVPGDVIYPGWFSLHEVINQNLNLHDSAPRLLWQQNRGKFRSTVLIVPGSLIAAIWIQFAKAVEGDRDHQQCEECKKWYEISGDRRGGARFCSDPCRFRAYRKRQKEAQQLHAAGAGPKDIAKQLGSDAKTVKGWISKGKRDVKAKAR